MRNIFTIICFLLATPLLMGQTITKFDPSQYNDSIEKNSHFQYIEIKIHDSSHLSGTRVLSDLFSNGAISGELRLGWQSTGRQQWQREWNYPQYGIGFYTGRMGGSELDTIVGQPSGLYGFFGMPWYRSQNGKFRFNTDLSTGISYDLNPYDPDINPYNDVIGSKINVFFNLNFGVYYKISERMDLTYGVGLIHFSNGRWRMPNMGINLIGGNIGAVYHFNPMAKQLKFIDPDINVPLRPVFYPRVYEPYKQRSEITLAATIGSNSNKPLRGPELEGNKFVAGGVNIEYAKQFWQRGKWVVGADLFVDGSLKETYVDYQYSDDGIPIDSDGNELWEDGVVGGTPDYYSENQAYTGTHPDDVGFDKIFMSGIHFGHELLIERFSFVTELGLYTFKKSDERGIWYMRVGGKIDVTEEVFINVTLKTQNGGISDWVEWGVGYRFIQ